MQVSNRIRPDIISAATGLLQPFIPELSTQNLVSALQRYGEEKETPVSPVKSFLTITQAAAALQVSKPTLYRIIRENKLPLLKASKRLSRIPADAVNAYLADGGYFTKGA